MLEPFTTEDALILLVNYYGEPHRRYHGPAHLLDVMRLWQETNRLRYWSDTRQALSAAVALGYHDAHYVPGATDNEEASAAIAMVAAKRYGVDPERVRQMVMATKFHDQDFNTDPDTELFLDIDVARLGRTRADYMLASSEVRLEFASFDDEQWSAGRRLFLKSMLARRSIFRSPIVLAGTSEQRARENLRHELTILETLP